MSNIIDLDELRKFRFNRPKKRGRPKKMGLGYPEGLEITISYHDDKTDEDVDIVLVPGQLDPIYPLHTINKEYKKLIVEIAIRLIADLCYGSDTAMIVEVQEWITHSIMNHNVVNLNKTEKE
jgi:hypothetical protein